MPCDPWRKACYLCDPSWADWTCHRCGVTWRAPAAERQPHGTAMREQEEKSRHEKEREEKRRHDKEPEKKSDAALSRQ